jgi:hypothetical protein
MRRVLLVLLVIAAVACGGDGESEDAGCEMWGDFLAETEGDASDAEAAAAAREVAEVTEDDEVRGMATGLAARLEDGTDLGNTLTGLGEACGL